MATKQIGTLWYSEETDKISVEVDTKFLVSKLGPMLLSPEMLSKINIGEMLFGKR